MAIYVSGSTQIQWRGPNIVTEGLVFYMNANSPSCYNSSSFFRPVPIVLPSSNFLRNLSGFTTYSGSVSGSTTFSNSSPSSSFSFPTTSSWIGVTDNPALQFGVGSFTIMLWAKPNDAIDRCALVSKRSQGTGVPQVSCLQGTIASDNTTSETKKMSMLLRFNSTNNYVANTQDDIADGNWKHMVFMRNSSVPSVSIYVNGVNQTLSPTFTAGTGILTSVSVPGFNINIGNNNSNGNIPTTDPHNVPYPISSVMIYNRALTAEEINYNYNNSKASYGL